MEEICRHNQNGYCKHGPQCKRKHVDIMCPNKNNCENTCVLRHPKTCKYFFMYQDCRFKNCAYSHDKAKSMADLEKLEQVVVVYSASYINLFDKQIGLITVEGFTVFRKWEQKQILSPAKSFSISCNSAIDETWRWWRIHYFIEEIHITIHTTNIIDVATGQVFMMPVGRYHFSTAVTMFFFPMKF